MVEKGGGVYRCRKLRGKKRYVIVVDGNVRLEMGKKGRC